MRSPEQLPTAGVLLLAAMTYLGAGGAVEADTPVEAIASRGEIAGLAGSERLRTFAWGQWLETGRAPREIVEAMRAGLARQGFYHDVPTPALVWTEAEVSPLLAYDSNINGGVLQDVFTFGGYIFEAAPEARAMAGVVIGVDGNAIARLAWDEGRTFEVSAGGTYGWAPESNLSFQSSTIRACARNHLARWMFLDGCLLRHRDARDLATARVERASLTLSNIFETSSAWHELSGEVAETRSQIGDQSTATVGLMSVWNRAVTEVTFTSGESIAGEIALDRRLGVDVRFMAQGNPVGVGVWASTADGGRFLGVERTDRAAGLTLSWQHGSGTTIEAGYVRRSSTVELFDSESLSLRIDVDLSGF